MGSERFSILSDTSKQYKKLPACTSENLKKFMLCPVFFTFVFVFLVLLTLTALPTCQDIWSLGSSAGLGGSGWCFDVGMLGVGGFLGGVLTGGDGPDWLLSVRRGHLGFGFVRLWKAMVRRLVRDSVCSIFIRGFGGSSRGRFIDNT